MTKEQLRLYRSIAREIDQLEQRIINLEMMGHNDDVTLPLRNLYREKLKKLIDGQLRIEQAIESLDPTERVLMRMRYMDGEDWLEICATIHYEWAQTHRIHAKALNKIKNL